MIPAEDLLKGFKNSLVTGATGFIGTNLVKVLSEKGVMVRVLFRKGSNIKLLDELAVEAYDGDLSNIEILEEAISDSTTVYNLATDTREFLQYRDYEKVNVSGLRNLLEASHKRRAKKFVHLSSIEVYGRNLPSYPVKEDYPPNPKTPFQKSKDDGDRVVLDFHKANPNLDVTIVRPPLALGPHDKAFSEKLLNMVYRGDVTLPLDGQSLLSFVYSKDLAIALHLIGKSGETAGEIYHVKSFDTTLVDLTKALGDAAGLRLSIRRGGQSMTKLGKVIMNHIRKRENREIDHHLPRADRLAGPRVIDDSKLRSLGYVPEYTLEKAAEELVSLYKKEKGVLSKSKHTLVRRE